MSSARHLCGYHAVREALRAGTPLRWLAIERGRQDARARELAGLAAAAGVPLRWESAAALSRHAAALRHQGIVAAAEERPRIELHDLLARPVRDADGRVGLLLALDGIEDPHNLGAIARSAAAAGVDGLLLPERRAAGLTGAVERVSAGALEHLQVARAGNLAQALRAARTAGYWVVGLAGDAPACLWDHDFTTPTLLVVGAEQNGLHRLTRDRCDALLSIPVAGIASLNASVAAGIALFEIVRQRRAHLPKAGNLGLPPRNI